MKRECLQAGVARIDISPPPGVPHAGWGAQTHQIALGIDMPLYATALVVSQGDNVVVIIDLDLIGFNEQQVAAFLHEVESTTGVPADFVRISSTHTHSGPNYFRSDLATEGLEELKSYMALLSQRAAKLVQEAFQSRRPAQVRYGEGYCPISVNRRAKAADGRIVVGRNPEGPVDHTVRVARFLTLQQETVATLLHFSCHPTLVGWQNQMITPDYPGPARQEVEKSVGGLCLFLQGAAGDVGPILGPTGNLDFYRGLGKSLGLEAASVAVRLGLPRSEQKILQVVESGAPLGVYSEISEEGDQLLDVRNVSIRLPLRTFGDPPSLQGDLLALKTRLREAREKGDPEKLRSVHAQATQATIRADLAGLYAGNEYLEWRVQAIRVGSGVLVGVPGEPFVEIGLKIASASPFPHTFFSGYTNGGFGYLPTARAHDEGGYEVETSPFAPESEAILVEAVLKLLSEMAESRPIGIRASESFGKPSKQVIKAERRSF